MAVERVKEIQGRIDQLAQQFLHAKGAERLRLLLEYMRLKDKLSEAKAGG